MFKSSTLVWCIGGVTVAAALALTAVLLLSRPSHYAELVPGSTVVYVRVQDVGTLKDRILGDGNLNKPEPIQAELDRQYDEALTQAAKGITNASKEDFERLAEATGTVHLAVWVNLEEPKTITYDNVDSSWLKPQAVVFIEIKDTDALTELAEKMGDKIKPTQIGDQAGYDLTKTAGMGDKVVGYFMGSVFVVGSETAVLQVISADADRLDDSLADNPRFKRAFDDWADEGDFFAFIDISGTAAQFQNQYDRQIERAAELPERNPKYRGSDYGNYGSEDEPLRESDKQRVKSRLEAKRKDTMDMFKAAEEFGYAAISYTADGKLSARVYAAEGKEIPEYLQRPSRVNELTKRVPEDAVFVMVTGYDGGEATRRSFSEYLNEKTGAGISPSKFNIPVEVADQLRTGMQELENEVVMMVDDYWLAVLPVKSEFGLVVAPNDKGAYGAVAVFDWEDREQVDKLHNKLFQHASRSGLAWKETQHDGLHIRYLDLADMIEKSGGKLDADTRENMVRFQLQLGYAISDTYCYAGSVDLIKQLHTPSGKSLHEAMDYEHLDEENALFWCLNVGAMIHGPKTGVEGVDDFLKLLSAQIPKDAKYAITVTATAEHITLRSNIPVNALAAWAVTDKDALTTPIDLLGSNTRDAKRAEGEQIMGSARDQCRVQHARSGEYPTLVPHYQDGAFAGTYFSLRERVYLKQGTGSAAIVVDPVGASPAGYGVHYFNFDSGAGREIKWFTTRAELEAELEEFVKPD